MGSIGDCFDNSAVENFFGTLQLELLDEHRWDTRKQLALAMFDWIETWTTRRDDTLTAQCSAPSTMNKPA